MLQNNKVVRKAHEKLYSDICSVTVREEYEKDNGATGFREIVLFENAPCRLSYKSVVATASSEAVATVKQEIKLFIAPELNIPPGCKITVERNGSATDYTRSGKSALYSSHQEVVLDLFERWS